MPERPTWIYVAGSSAPSERPRVLAAMARVRAHQSMRLTHDWVAVIDAVRAAGEALHDAVRRRSASDDLGGVARADVLWLLAPDVPSTGAWVELGYALGGGHCGVRRRIVVSGPARPRCVFAALADVECDSDEDAWQAICAQTEGES